MRRDRRMSYNFYKKCMAPLTFVLSIPGKLVRAPAENFRCLAILGYTACFVNVCGLLEEVHSPVCYRLGAHQSTR